MSRVQIATRALRKKFGLLSAFGTMWPAAMRGGKLLARGRFREFGRKLFNEMDDVRTVDAMPKRGGPRLFLAGHILGKGGYDHVVLAILKGLTEAGVDVCRDAQALQRHELIPGGLRPTEARRTNEPRLAVVPPHILHRFRPDDRTVAFTMWETDTLPAGAVAALNRCGMVIVPSAWGANCFRTNGVTVPIVVVPLGHDPATFHPTAEKPNGICFGTAGALDEGGVRKNVQHVIDGFRRAFPTDTNVRLRVKITPTSPDVVTHADPRIDVVKQSLSVAELAAWYRSLTAFVNASHGEGFGLHLLEAMACGRPLVSTTFSGVSAFFDTSVGYEVGYRLVDVRNAIYAGRWAKPDEAELIAQMRAVRANPAKALKLGAAAATRAARLTWDDTTRKLVIVLIQRGFIHPPGERSV